MYMLYIDLPFERNVYSCLFVGLTLSELTAQAVLFFVAGSDTTATTLTFLCYNLALHPEIQERLTEEIHNVIGTKVCKFCDEWRQKCIGTKVQI